MASPRPRSSSTFDFSSPYSYIASEWIEALAARTAATVRWQAILLGATFQAAELKSPVAPSDQARVHAARLRALGALRRRAVHDCRTRSRSPTQNAARVFWWLARRAIADARRALGARTGLRAYFTRDVDLADPAALKQLAAEFGLDADEAERVWTDAGAEGAAARRATSAIAHGVFGAPFFVVDGERFWGNDRRAQIERWLAGGPF